MPGYIEFIRDPMLQAAWVVLLAIIFAGAAVHKLRDRENFLGQLAAYQLLPQSAHAAAVVTLIAFECFVVAALIWTISRPIGMALAAVLLTVYALAIAINLIRGRRDIDCGCGGQAQRLDGLLVLRNLLLVAITLCVVGPPLSRPIEAFDYVAGIAVSVGFYGAYCVCNELIRQTGRLGHLRALEANRITTTNSGG